jgi:hypothetical protein
MMVFKKGHFWVVVFIALSCLQGCGESIGGTYQVENYRCTSDQLDLVKKEFDICKGTCSDQYCYLQAKKTQCALIAKTKEI